MGAFLVTALAAPEAFGEHALLFAIAYAAARWLHIFIFAEANDDIDAGEAIRRLSRTALAGAAAADRGRRSSTAPAQAALWIVALGARLRRGRTCSACAASACPRPLRRALRR